MQEELASWVIVHQEVEMGFGLETGMEVYCVIVVAHADQVFPLAELGHQRLVICYGLL